MTPEVYLMQCDGDGCGVYSANDRRYTTRLETSARVYMSRKLAREDAPRDGWYIGDEELCPECAAKRGKHGDA